jgi:hypothetical protein
MRELKEWLLYQQSFYLKNMNKCIQEDSDYEYWAGKLDATTEVLKYIKD